MSPLIWKPESAPCVSSVVNTEGKCESLGYTLAQYAHSYVRNSSVTEDGTVKTQCSITESYFLELGCDGTSWVMVVHLFNLSTPEAEKGRSLVNTRPTWSGQAPKLQRNLAKRKKKDKKLKPLYSPRNSTCHNRILVSPPYSYDWNLWR